MVRGTLDEDHPAFSRVGANLVDLEPHLVLGALYPVRRSSSVGLSSGVRHTIHLRSAPARADYPRDANSPGPRPGYRRARPARRRHPGPHRRLRRPARPLPGRPRRRSRPPGRRRVDPPGQGRARRRVRPRRQPEPPHDRPPAHRRRHPRPHHRPRRPARHHPRRRTPREGSHLRATRAPGHLPARTRQNPGRRDDQPGDIRSTTGTIWGNGSCVREGGLEPPSPPACNRRGFPVLHAR